MRLLVTGAHGFVGRQCLRPALETGFEVHGVLHSREHPESHLAQLPVKWHRADLLSPGEADSLIREISPSHLLHAAWFMAHHDHRTSLLNFDWLIASARLALAFGRCRTHQRLVSVGTSAEYASTDEVIVENVSPESPTTLFGEAKLLAHRTIETMGRRLDFSAATARIFGVYGPYEDPKRIVPRACLSFSAGKSGEFSDVCAIRDVMHVEDAGRALIALLNAKIEGPCNICSGQAARMVDVIEMVAEISGFPHLFRSRALSYCAEDPPKICGDNSRLRSIGWEPTVPLFEGLARTFAWWQSQPALVQCVAEA
jgi:nucleoside-diphosphate-sugar epimerase